MKNASGKRPSKFNRKVGTTTTPTNAHQCMKVYYIQRIPPTCFGHMWRQLTCIFACDIVSRCPVHGHKSFKINGKYFLVLHPHLLYPSHTFRIFMSLPAFFLKANTAT